MQISVIVKILSTLPDLKPLSPCPFSHQSIQKLRLQYIMASRNPAFDRLLSYSQKNDNVSITSLLATGCPATHANGVGQTALHIAALWGNSQALSALLAEIPLGSSDLNLQNRISGATPLHCATQSNKEITGRVECVKLLVAHGASVTVKDSYGDEANKYTDNGEMRNLLGGQSLELHELVKTGDASAITAYVQSSESPLATLSTTDSDGNTPLCLAIIANLEEVALLLLGMVPPDPNDAPVGTLSPSLFLVNLSNNDNSTPLILAARCGMTSVVSKLLEMNADPLKQDFASDDDGMAVMMGGPPSPHFTALHYAAHNKDLELVEMLLKNGGDSQTNGSLVDDELAMKPWHHLFDRGE